MRNVAMRRSIACAGISNKPLYVKVEFLCHAQSAVRAEIAIIAVSQHHEPMIKRAVKDMLAHVAPTGRAAAAASMSEFSSAARMSRTLISISRELPFDPPRS